ncbi:MAG: APC family permease [Clostridia bacterium]|nr:APC family permease [Clostridia bacterium]
MGKKKFRMIDAVLTCICVIFVAEAAAPVASIGNSQYFWWLFMLILFLLPYGLISSELGTTYDNGGGLYDWVSQGMGKKMATRASWYYWVNFPLWMASLAVMIPGLITYMTGFELPLVASVLVQLAFVWIIYAIASTSLADANWILNGAAVIKVVLAVFVGGLGIYGLVKNGGMANPITGVKDLLPSFDMDSLSYISVIIFNLLGFEVICTMSDDMENPKKQIPQAIVISGLVVAFIYMFGAFGIGAGVPASELTADSGMIDAVIALTGKEGGILITATAFLFMLTLFGNMASWSTGVNEVAAMAADNGDMPAIFGKRNSKERCTGAAMLNSVVASVVVILGVIMEKIGFDELFWAFFALNLVTFLAAYLPIFPAFLRLRKNDPDTERPFKVPGGKVMTTVMAIIPMILIAISIVFTVWGNIPVIIGTVIAVIIGEILVAKYGKKA